MNSRITAGDAAFSVHVGDILKGVPDLQSSPRCNPYSFAARKDLFSAIPNFLIIPGDNEWNECIDYNPNSNTDRHRDDWRSTFAEGASPFYQFSMNFPRANNCSPIISRKVGNPEIFYFEYNNVAFFGLNRVMDESYVSDNAPVDLNEEWVEDVLGSASCDLESIVIFSHTLLKDALYNKLDAYFNNCGSTLPTLTITGNEHPTTYCMTKSNERIDVVVEAYRAGPILVSIVRDPDGMHGDSDFVHIEDPDPADTNSQCPF
mmetsp:Transcript_8871/g.15421  ORF Transcript_8871/g.15421 Transcript_8871/m.15421 type:complete len:261 (-) Transcript_8871:106-888(-)|eukprot:CAMPEP_0183787810 /NCGR_PEP_ID=MMETSP0739-20130205/67734_1 /TAXON_ID=385413 /ORGANISM="Thalassiosira miniscula, Strain CCMP1093" /LENGTH=260 /DNA_ID=CAMNT_0026031903 /DNA_START=1425 /DNA_END=2207 /DNA_ORIENTATION=+